MIHPKNKKAKAKCRPGCSENKLCSPCRNFRQSFKVGHIITWGSCVRGFEIVEITRFGPVYKSYGSNQTVEWSQLELKKAPKTGLL